jgi:hypothetical protein
MFKGHSHLINLFGALYLSFAGIAYSQSDVSSSEPAVFASTTAGFTYYESKLVDSNVMVMTSSYSAGVYGGELRKAGIVLDMENGSFKFGLNGSKINSSTLDVSLRYLLSPFFAGVVLSNGQMSVSAPPDEDGNGHLDPGGLVQDYMKVSSRGIGTIIGANVEVNKMASVFFDTTVVETVDVNESYIDHPLTATVAPKKDVKIGRRLKMNIGGIVQLTKKNLDFNFGYQYQGLPVTASGESFNEKRDTIFAGLRFRASF